MKLYISKPEERDTVLMILGYSGYTVRQGTETASGTKKRVSFVEVVEDGK